MDKGYPAFKKYDALGNDYLVIDPNKSDIDLTAKNIRLLCDRHHGVGSDGILLGPFLKEGEFGLRIFNPDGSECEKSGNGLRIFARFLVDARYVVPPKFSIRLLYSGQSIDIDCLDERAENIKVNMGGYSLAAPDFPSSSSTGRFLNEMLLVDGKEVQVSCVNIGNPHCVVLNQPVTPAVAKTLGPLISEHVAFPNRTNVQFAEIKSRHSIAIEIWERGAGYTKASGSSSCAVAVACFELGLVEREVEVSMPGGKVEVVIDDRKIVHLTGSVLSVFEGTYSPNLKKKLFNV